ncbi:MAG: hypothetical protein RL721_52 [Candidatus Eisenbacteria bacterium]
MPSRYTPSTAENEYTDEPNTNENSRTHAIWNASAPKPESANSHATTVRVRASSTGSAVGAASAAAGAVVAPPRVHAMAATSRLSPAATNVVAVSPRLGSSRKPAASEPATAPSVLSAYSRASAAPTRSRSTCATSTGRVAPMSAAGGSRNSTTSPRRAAAKPVPSPPSAR